MSHYSSSRFTRWIIPCFCAVILGIGLFFYTQNQGPASRQAPAKSSQSASSAADLLPPANEAPLLVANPAPAPAAAKPAPQPAADPTPVTAQDLPLDFLDRIVSGQSVALILPDGRRAEGGIQLIERDANGILFVQGRLTKPEPGFYFFQRQTTPGVAGSLVGNIRFDDKDDAWKIEPNGTNGTPRLNPSKLDQIICASYAMPPDGGAEEAPQTHPYPIPIPPYQTIVPLQSLPGATAVVYLDFDGEKGPFPGWGDFDAAPASGTNADFFNVWKMVCEDFQGFNINITTDRKVFDNAPEGRRMHCIISPTNTAAPGAGGVAYVNSFNWTGDRVCWAFYSTGKSAAEVISHEVGHTLGLSHDGRTSPQEGYYGGHGNGPTGWAPIMGVGYYQNLSQWSKGEYLDADQKQDDLKIITTQNNDVAYRTDDAGEDLASAIHLEIANNNTVSNEGIIEKTGDMDAFRFVTTGGQANFNVNPVSQNPNLDIYAEIVNATTLAVVVSDNPDLALNANVSTYLPADEYLLRIRGTGRGDPLGNGYTNYGCIGSYLITGSVVGGVKPIRFTLAENSPIGSNVGTVIPRNNHGGGTLTFAIASGNQNSAFAIDSTTGIITVANSAALDYEALSLRWDDLATIELFVSITDINNPTLNESLRTVITVTNINESPTITGGAMTILEHTLLGTKVIQVLGSDADRFDFPTYSIVSGNAGNVFDIDSATGQITVAADIDVSSNTTYHLTIRATDQGAPPLTATATVSITVINTVAGIQPGQIVRTYFDNINGGTIANLTGNTKFPNNPDSQEFLASFDGGDHGDNYGSTIRGYLIPPTSGNYQFWIASDDASELRISPTASPASATVRASVAGYTNRYDWTAKSSQQSAQIYLTAGNSYYIEARHKEGGGDDHVAVAWSGPGISRQVISGLYLAPYYQNYAPKLKSATYTVRENSLPGQTFGTVTASDVNDQDSFHNYTITGGNTGGVFGIDSAAGQLVVLKSDLLNATTKPTYTLTIQTTDNGTPARTGSGSITINVTPSSGLNVTGIVQEIWTGISGTTISNLTGNSKYPYRPTLRRTLTSFDSVSDYSDNYGSRIRAQFVPPTSGNYTFYVSGDDETRLLFSANNSGVGATRIAYVTEYSSHNEWTKFSTQKSTAKTLVAGQAVYLETLHKEGGGGDHVSVGYTGPNTPTITVIPGSMLLPFDINAPPTFSPSYYLFNLNGSSAIAGTIVGSVTATDPNAEPLIFAITSGDSAGAFAISSGGVITVANPAALTNGSSTLQVATQDGGLGGVYPLASTTATVVVQVAGLNSAPIFGADPISMPDATDEIAYLQSLANSATDPDPGDTLTFSKSDGPTWLSISPTGELAGTPGEADLGLNSFRIRATDTGGLFAEATLEISVIGGNEAPAFTESPITFEAVRDFPFSGTVTATDPDPSDALTYTKIDGPSWLTVSTDGSFDGIPLFSNLGKNTFTVRVTDTGGLYDETTLDIRVFDNPTWTNPTGGEWPNLSNWLAGIVGEGVDRTINFSTLDLTADRTVDLNGPRTVGHLLFGDTTPTHNWTIENGTGGPLTFAATNETPSIVVINQTAILNTGITGTQGLVKSGSGTLTLGGTNSYIGSTIIADGTLIVNGSQASASTIVDENATLSGTGTLAGTVSVHGTVAPGEGGPGKLTVNNTLTLAANSKIAWEISDWTGEPGYGFDTISVSALDITATSANPVIVRLADLALLGFTETGKSFTIVSAAEAITGFDAAKFQIDSAGFAAGAGTWSMQQTDETIELVYTRANTAPIFTADPILLTAAQDIEFSDAITAVDNDLDEILTYTKISGPAWLVVAESGALSGTPSSDDIGPNSFIVRVSDVAGLTAEAILVIEVVLAPVADANGNGILDAWEIAKFGNADTGENSADGDPDGDGLSNLLEFAFDTHPTEPNASPITSSIITIGPDQYLQLTTPKNPEAVNLAYSIEVTSDLTDDSWSALPIIIVSETANELIVRDQQPIHSASRRFMRLKVRTLQ